MNHTLFFIQISSSNHNFTLKQKILVFHFTIKKNVSISSLNSITKDTTIWEARIQMAILFYNHDHG
jgi:hypothetical protein